MSLEDYVVKEEDTPHQKNGVAIPKVSEYREKLKNKTLTPADIIKRRGKKKYNDLRVPDGLDDRYTGSGLEYDIL